MTQMQQELDEVKAFSDHCRSPSAGEIVVLESESVCVKSTWGNQRS